MLVTCCAADQLLQPHEEPICEGQLCRGAKDDALAVAADTLQAELGVQVRPHKDLQQSEAMSASIVHWVRLDAPDTAITVG